MKKIVQYTRALRNVCLGLVVVGVFSLVPSVYANIIPVIQLLLLDDEDQPDECGDPKTPVLRIGDRIRADLTPGDQDWFRIENPNFYRNVKFASAGETDTYAELYEGCDTFDAVDSHDDVNYPDNPNFIFEYNLEAGKTYFLRVNGYTTGRYRLEYDLTEEYTYLSAKHYQVSTITPGTLFRSPETELGTNNNTPYYPEFGDEDYKNLGIVNAYDRLEESYYFSVDPNGQRTTLDDWKTLHGFDNNPNVVTAEYINAYDLGLGRRMSCLMDSNVDWYSRPCVVENYLIGDDPDNPDSPVFLASVAMERVKNQANPFATYGDRNYTAFFVFDAAGRRINSVDLDGSGPKRVPEACWSCHDGIRFSTTHGGQEGSNNGQYLPFDLKLFKQFPGGLSINHIQQLDNFRKLNDIVYQVYEDDRFAGTAYYRNAHKQIADLIKYWYNGSRPASVSASSPTKFHLPAVPHGVNDARSEFYGQYCQTCHVSQTVSSISPSRDSDCLVCHGTKKDSNNNDVYDSSSIKNLQDVVCENTGIADANRMPNAKVTHLRFIQENFDANGAVKNGSKLKALESVLGHGLCPNGYANEIYPKNLAGQ